MAFKEKITIKVLILCTVISITLAAEKSATKNVTVSTSTLVTDLSKEETGHVSSFQLEHGESRSRSKSHTYSKDGRGYGNQNPIYEKSEYEERAVEYDKEAQRGDDYYKTSAEDPFRHSQLSRPQEDDYDDSFENPYGRGNPFEQRNPFGQRDRDHSYEEVGNGKGSSFPYGDKNDNRYRHEDYSKEESYESKEDGGYGGKPPYLQQGFEPSRKQQQPAYDPLDVPDADGKSGYGVQGTKIYPPKPQEERLFYPRTPAAHRYSRTQKPKENEYQSEEKDESYYSGIPKEAGYIPNDHKEPEYLQRHTKGSGPKVAGYLPRTPTKSGFTPVLPKEQASVFPGNGNVAIYIKQLGHSKTEGRSENSKGKERHGYLLLPIAPEKIGKEFQLAKVGVYGSSEEKDALHEGKIPIYGERSRTHGGELIDGTPKYAGDAKPAFHYVTTYDEEKGDDKLGKSLGIIHNPYGILHQISGPSAYSGNHFANQKVAFIPELGSPEVSPYAQKDSSSYEQAQGEKFSPVSPLIYGGPHGVLPGYTGQVKYIQTPVYEKQSSYGAQGESFYDVTTQQKVVPVKVKGFQPSSYGKLLPIPEYSGVVDFSSYSAKAKKKNADPSHLYSTQYKNVGTRLGTNYERSQPNVPSVKKTKAYALIIQKQQEAENTNFRPIVYPNYSNRGSSKILLDNLGLRNFRSFMPKSGNSGTGVGYYNLQTLPTSSRYSAEQVSKSSPKNH